MRLLVSSILIAASGVLALAQSPPPSALDAALRAFWSADNPQRASGAARQ